MNYAKRFETRETAEKFAEKNGMFVARVTAHYACSFGVEAGFYCYISNKPNELVKLSAAQWGDL